MAISPARAYQWRVLLIVELLAAWLGLSLALGLPLGRAIRRADVREYPLRDTPWWCGVADDEAAELDEALVHRRPVAV